MEGVITSDNSNAILHQLPPPPHDPKIPPPPRLLWRLLLFTLRLSLSTSLPPYRCRPRLYKAVITYASHWVRENTILTIFWGPRRGLGNGTDAAGLELVSQDDHSSAMMTWIITVGFIIICCGMCFSDLALVVVAQS